MLASSNGKGKDTAPLYRLRATYVSLAIDNRIIETEPTNRNIPAVVALVVWHPFGIFCGAAAILCLQLALIISVHGHPRRSRKNVASAKLTGACRLRGCI